MVTDLVSPLQDREELELNYDGSLSSDDKYSLKLIRRRHEIHSINLIYEALSLTQQLALLASKSFFMLPMVLYREILTIIESFS
jgi:hypothetical protein